MFYCHTFVHIYKYKSNWDELKWIYALELCEINNFDQNTYFPSLYNTTEMDLYITDTLSTLNLYLQEFITFNSIQLLYNKHLEPVLVFLNQPNLAYKAIHDDLLLNVKHWEMCFLSQNDFTAPLQH